MGGSEPPPPADAVPHPPADEGAEDEDAAHSAPEQVLRRLRSGILDGEIESGTRLKINDLAGALNVSHMPVREALHLLVMEGLAVREPRRGVVVRPLTVADVAAAYHVTGALEGLAARHAAATLDAAGADRLRRLLAPERGLVAAGEREALLRLNRAFHGAIQDSFANSWAETFVRQVRNYTYRVRRVYPQSGPRLAAVVAEHEAIVAAIGVRDPEAAERLTRLHAERAADGLIAQIRQHEASASPPGARARGRRPERGGRRRKGGAQPE